MTTLSFSPWQLFENANPVVQFVMIMLLLACLISWTIFIAKYIEIFRLNHNLLIDKFRLQNAKELMPDIDLSKKGIGRTMLLAITDEYQCSNVLTHDSEGLKERIVLLLERIESNEGHFLNKGTGFLATIGAISPFIGLFGTVWGIMTSFTGIVSTQTTSLTAVAPGIAEALLATAVGLVTAIPAVIFYNMILRSNANCRSKIADLSTIFMRLVSRDISKLQIKDTNTQIIPFQPKMMGEKIS